MAGTHARHLIACAAALALVLAWAAPARGIAESGDSPWNVTTKVGPDAQVGGWFVNLGLTGIRARLTAADARAFQVAYVFPDTAAAGKVAVGDRIVGAGGKAFTAAHKHGYGMDKFGAEGPLLELADALERCQAAPGAARGRLVLTVVRKDATREEQVALALPTTWGAFGPTYPFNCPKSDRILREAYAYLVENQRPDGTWNGRPHINALAALALLASGKPEHRPAVKRAAEAFAKMTDDKVAYEGLQAWKYTLGGIVLAEYYLATREPWVLPELEEINRWLTAGLSPNSGWGHNAWNSGGDTNGYGAINVITMQGKLAWSLMARCGIDIDKRRYAVTHDFVARGTNAVGYVWYKDGGAKNPGYADMGRTGAAALAHAMSPFGDPAYAQYARRAAKCIGEHPKTFADTHGSPILGMAWTALGAAIDPPSLRALLDDNRWWFALAHCPDGTFVYQPNRDNNPQDYGAAPRLSATAAVALVFSLRDGHLAIMGETKPAKP